MTMTDRIDHAAEARRVLAVGRESAAKAKTAAQAGFSSEANGHGAKAHGCWMQAQAEATLALVEQQRIANHIAYVQLLEAQYAEAENNPDEFDWDTREASTVRHRAALGRIREGLGL